jgi:RNA polymerase sigma factor (sigma-70 family)
VFTGVSDDVAIVGEPVVLVAARAEFDDFYRSNYVRVLRTAFAVTGERELAADVAQEAFLIAHRRWVAIVAYDRPDLWVSRVAINRALSWRRRTVNELNALTRLALRRERVGQSTATGDLQTGGVWKYVRRLPLRQAAVVALVYADDLTIEEAARALGIGLPTAKTHLQRAKRSLAIWMNEEYRDDR